LLQGRAISEENFLQARNVAVVSRAFVSTYLKGENALGQTLKLRPDESWLSIPPVPFEIIGVVADTKDNGSDGAPRVYVPYAVPGAPFYTLFVRTMGEPERLANSVRQVVAAIDKEVPVDTYTLREDLDSALYDEPRFVMTMLVAFASMGLVLVSVGVYSVLSYAVSRRTQEIGIRIALGAEATDVRRMVMMSGLRWLLVGIGIGVPASIALARILQNRIWGIKSADPLTLVAVSLLLTAVGLAACYFPARRATKVDTLVALRYE
jgi:hypothetical protein